MDWRKGGRANGQTISYDRSIARQHILIKHVGLLILKAVNRDTKININSSRNSGHGGTNLQHTLGSGCFSHIKQVMLGMAFKHVPVHIQAATATKHFYVCNDTDQAACFELQNSNITSIRLLNFKPCITSGF
jgi:hypothetical protein